MPRSEHRDKYMQFLSSDDYLNKARLRETLACELFCRSDKHYVERQNRAGKLDAMDLLKAKELPPPRIAWIVGPELAGAEREAADLAKYMLSIGITVNVVSRRNLEHLLPESGKLVTHFVKPLESYIDHVQYRGRVIVFFLPLAAGLAVRGIRSVYVSTSDSLNDPQIPAEVLAIPDFVAGHPPVGGRRTFSGEPDDVVGLLSMKSSGIPIPPCSPTISACIIAKNEEGIIEGCLESLVPLADETIVNDTGSADGTADIAAEYGAKVMKTEWRDNFSDARNDSLSPAKSTHILVIDADERVAQDTVRDAKLKLLDPGDGWQVQIRDNLDGKMHYLQILRLFSNKPYHRFVGNVHEQVWRSIRGRLASSPLILDHLGYKSTIVAVKKKRQRNIGLLLEQSKREDVSNQAYLSFQAATEMMFSGSYLEAVTILRDVVESTPVSAAFRPLAGQRACNCYVFLDEIDNAYNLAKKLLTEYPGFLDLAEIVAEACLDRGLHEQALALLKEVSSATGSEFLPRSEGADSYRLSTLLCRISIAEGNLDQAFRHIKEALEASPDYANAQTLLVSYWPNEAVKVLGDVKAGTVRAAVTACLRAGRAELAKEIAIASPDAGAMGEIFLALGKHADAAKAFFDSEKAWDRSRAAILSACGFTPKITFESDNALLDKLLNGRPCGIDEVDDALKTLGFFLDLKAVDKFKTGLGSLSPHGEQRHAMAARLLANRGFLKEAYEHALLASDSPDSLPLKAKIAQGLEKFADAAAHYAILGSMRTLSVKEYVNYVNCLTKADEMDIARAVGTAAIQSYPDNPIIGRLAGILRITQPT